MRMIKCFLSFLFLIKNCKSISTFKVSVFDKKIERTFGRNFRIKNKEEILEKSLKSYVNMAKKSIKNVI